MNERLELLQQARLWLQQGHRVALIHVAQTWGSSPRPVGSLLALSSCGQHHGSVSGGCVEEDLFSRLATGEIAPGSPRLIRYSNEQAGSVRLPCRGELLLVVEWLRDAAELQPLLDAIEQRRPLIRQLPMDGSPVQYRAGWLDTSHYDGRSLSEGYGPLWRVLLIGANELARQVARLCLLLGYEVLVCDPRETYQRQWQEPATQLTTLMPDEAVSELLQDEHGALLSLSHDPKLDDMAILQALQGPAFYIGALGSRRSAQRRLQTLRQMGSSDAQLARLEAPIGLNIGSRTPAEIAIAIVARLIQVRSTLQPRQGLREVG